MSFNKDKLENRFKKEYEKLNEQQRLAVDTIEGPVMVIAGPGTGKTQILASRVGKILLETDASPENILCLTFTDAGVVAMRKRLVELIGPEAYKVDIHTYHSFCNSVIQENIRLFNKKELEPLSDLERVQFLKQLIDGFEKDNPLKRYKGDIYYDISNLASFFSAIKREGWEESWLLQKIDEYVSDILPETDGFYNKSDKKKGITSLTQKGKDQVERMEKLKAAVKAFSLYKQILDEHHRYDYDDMITWVIRIFEKNPDVLLNYQERFQYILVDEYQDTSGSQNRIVELLISYWKDESPNLFVVGDDDQSIYRFQGANLENLMNLAGRFEKDLVKVVLTQNYRSVQPVLDAARLLIENNEQRLVKKDTNLTKELTAANPALKDLIIYPEIHVYENEFAENVKVTLAIKNLIQKGVPPGNIAVIYYKHRFGDELLKFLQLEEVPFFVKKSLDLLKDVFIKKIVNIIRYTVAETDMPGSGDTLLFEILHYDFFRLTPFKIATICNEIADNRKNKTGIGSLRSYLQQLRSSNSETLFAKDEQTSELIRIFNLLEDLQKQMFNKPVQQWFEQLVNEAGILAYIMQQPDKLLLMSKLSSLYDYIKDETHRRPELSIKQLLVQLDLMRENDLSLELVQTTGSNTGVNLLTCHGSKGLEFEYVFLINACNDAWEGKKNLKRGFFLPPNVFGQESKAEIIEELRRLFFVSVTRAEKYLYISYPRMKNDGKLQEPSQFVEEIKQPLGLKPIEINLTGEEKVHFGALRFGVVSKPVLQQAEKDYADRLLSNFVMNVTALNNYLDCPLRFYYTNLVRVPSAKSEAAAFGTAVHAALADFINYMMNNGRIYPGKDFLVNRFIYHLQSEREIFTQESLARFLELGQDVMAKYYDHYYADAPKGDFILTEYPLTKVVLNGIPLKGFTDKIQFWGNDIVITDFKTGSVEKARDRGEFSKPGENKEIRYGGNYWRQAVFYKILVDNLPGKNWKVLYTQFDFVEPGKNNEFVIERLNITNEDIQQVTQQIQKVWQKIQQHDFYTGCGKPQCEWCNFVRDNKLYLRLEEEEPAEL